MLPASTCRRYSWDMDWLQRERIRLKHRIPSVTMAEMQGEVAALVARGVDVAEACSIIGLPPALYYDGCSAAIEFLPTPREIAAITRRMQAGERVCTRRSQVRWQRLKVTATGNESEADAVFELAGRIDDDACDVPAWLNCGGS
ncbi:hypothetical protein Mal15_38090 [Stieleria maiorica]|uniref:Uncharacterized protein n=1 Tax=Stieleria maiorica TaxID=2795974 RepID=A0A5B9MFX5_9BACT|nr:hypothetical protein [Stieleria maiorica]QEF99743.1 hypothetical protein Mal15_38090 [Stieleria maiorica]